MSNILRYLIVGIVIYNFISNIVESIQNNNIPGAITELLFLFLIFAIFIPIEIYSYKYKNKGVSHHKK